MRSTQDLIAELEDEATRHWIVMMVVGFENTTVFIKPNEPDRLRVLDDAVRVGGEPVGLIAADKGDGELTMMCRVYPEIDWEEGAEKYLSTLIGGMAKSIEEKMRKDKE